MPERTKIAGIVPYSVSRTLMNASGSHNSFKCSMEACSKKTRTKQPAKPDNYNKIASILGGGSFTLLNISHKYIIHS